MKHVCTAVVLLALSLNIGTLYAITTKADFPDSDGDSFWDGADTWYAGYWHIGEDKNGNGKYEPLGTDGIADTEDDETDPNHPGSYPQSDNDIKDSDGDKLPDEDEDFNSNGVYDEGDATNLLDRDTDDDGLDDYFEESRSPESAYLFSYMSSFINAKEPDSDEDGLPDGLEWGVTSPISGAEYTIRGTPVIVLGTDTSAQFSTNIGGSIEYRYCFISDQNPNSITDPTSEDTNYDGVNDGVQDVNFNGTRDAGETDPAVGPMYHYDAADPARYINGAISDITPRRGDNDTYDNVYSFFDFAVQMEDSTPPTILFEDDNTLGVRDQGIVRVGNTNMFLVSIQWKAAGAVNTVTVPGVMEIKVRPRAKDATF